ncbi:MAG TPA: TetR/AcrR family transcriptional regulator [Phototrophicaceae bacterium]|nr:TetR/AcrR family transcriptional regulator [Phototrophicaceae bacterium]
MNALPLRERNRQRVRQRIIAAAAALFGSGGYSQTTMDEIAARAEVSRATLFNYFPTKDALLIPFAVEIFQKQIQPRLIEYLATEPSTLDAFRFLFTDIQRYVFALPGIDQAFQRAIMQPHAIDQSSTIYEAGFIGSLIQILRYGQTRGEVRADIPLDQQANYIAALYVSIFYGLIMQAETGSEYTREIDAMLSFIQSGMRA